MILFLAAISASAAPVPASDLAKPVARAVSQDQASLGVPPPPRGIDVRPARPEVEMALLDIEQGPVLRIGAFGGRHGAAPKLAHVAVGWRF